MPRGPSASAASAKLGRSMREAGWQTYSKSADHALAEGLQPPPSGAAARRRRSGRRSRLAASRLDSRRGRRRPRRRRLPSAPTAEEQLYSEGPVPSADVRDELLARRGASTSRAPPSVAARRRRRLYVYAEPAKAAGAPSAASAAPRASTSYCAALPQRGGRSSAPSSSVDMLLLSTSSATELDARLQLCDIWATDATDARQNARRQSCCCGYYNRALLDHASPSSSVSPSHRAIATTAYGTCAVRRRWSTRCRGDGDLRGGALVRLRHRCAAMPPRARADAHHRAPPNTLNCSSVRLLRRRRLLLHRHGGGARAAVGGAPSARCPRRSTGAARTARAQQRAQHRRRAEVRQDPLPTRRCKLPRSADPSAPFEAAARRSRGRPHAMSTTANGSVVPVLRRCHSPPLQVNLQARSSRRASSSRCRCPSATLALDFYRLLRAPPRAESDDAADREVQGGAGRPLRRSAS